MYCRLADDFVPKTALVVARRVLARTIKCFDEGVLRLQLVEMGEPHVLPDIPSLTEYVPSAPTLQRLTEIEWQTQDGYRLATDIVQDRVHNEQLLRQGPQATAPARRRPRASTTSAAAIASMRMDEETHLFIHSLTPSTSAVARDAQKDHGCYIPSITTLQCEPETSSDLTTAGMYYRMGYSLMRTIMLTTMGYGRLASDTDLKRIKRRCKTVRDTGVPEYRAQARAKEKHTGRNASRTAASAPASLLASAAAHGRHSGAMPRAASEASWG
ncbi:hypothetical protein C8R46DRAFT_1235291 [Mycena filopes]|nr:hypothetical protein C8R46DRAFT_1235291 [Mycena filopes]